MKHHLPVATRAFLEATTDGVLLLDSGGRVLFCNPAATEILGRTAEDLVGSSFDVPSQGDARVPVEIQRSDGEERTVRFGVAHAEEAGEHVTILTLEDITELQEAWGGRAVAEEKLRRREAELFESQKLEAVGRLAGGIAHDYNNVLGAILGNTELLLQEMGEDNGLRDHLVEIRELTHRSTELTRQLLAFSRQQHLEPISVDLGNEILALEPLFDRLLGEQISVELQVQPTGSVLVDPSQFQQVVLNLLINARDAMSEGGRVLLRLRERAVERGRSTVFGETVDPGRYAELSVRDEGPGISPDVLPQVVEPFFTTRPLGHGLGLSTVFGIVQQSEGALDYVDAPGGGAEFRVLLPLSGKAAEPRSRPEPPEDEPTAEAGGPHYGMVLVIEDEARLRTVIRKMLHRAGFDVVEACHGEEALAIDRETLEKVAIVLSDLVMPGDPGPEVVRKLRRKVPELPVVYMTGYSEADISAAARDEGPILAKPFSFKELVGRLRKARRSVV